MLAAIFASTCMLRIVSFQVQRACGHPFSCCLCFWAVLRAVTNSLKMKRKKTVLSSIRQVLETTDRPC